MGEWFGATFRCPSLCAGGFGMGDDGLGGVCDERDPGRAWFGFTESDPFECSGRVERIEHAAGERSVSKPFRERCGPRIERTGCECCLECVFTGPGLCRGRLQENQGCWVAGSGLVV